MSSGFRAVATGIIYAAVMTAVFLGLRFAFADFSFSNRMISTVCVGAFVWGFAYSMCDTKHGDEYSFRFASIATVVVCTLSWLVQRFIN